ncbi:MAG: hypothetical protein KKE35_00750 [Actinobacteria bacterium]|nr:hypothetical protein [Actinomycetota bacterium]
MRINNKAINDKVIKKFLNLLDKGYGLEYCLEKFSPYRKDLESYLKILKGLENLGSIKNDEKLEDSILEKIYQSNNQPGKIPENNYDVSRIRVRPAFLKPAIIFLSVFVFFTLSFAGTVYASESSLPGEALYSVKRTYEDAQIVFTPYSNEGKLYFSFLNKRIFEADNLLNRDDAINEEAVENLLGEIDFNYGKCLEHKSFGKNDGERIGKFINGLRETFQKRRGANCNSYGQQANDNQNLEQQKGNINQNIQKSQNGQK